MIIMSTEGTQSPEMILKALGIIKRTCEEHYKKDTKNPCMTCPLSEESFSGRNICKINNSGIPLQWELTKSVISIWKAFL